MFNAGDTRDVGLILGSGRSLARGNGNPFQYSCLENPMDGGAWKPVVHGFAKSWTRLNDFSSGIDGSSIMDGSGQYLLKPLINLGFTKLESFGP